MKIKSRIIMTLLVVFWAGVIFSLSAQNAQQSNQVSGQVVEMLLRVIVPGYDGMTVHEKENILNTVTLLIRKGAHFSEYLILGALLWGWCAAFDFRGRKLIFGPLAAGCFYAVTDELHQMFSDGRSPQIGDVGIDSAGVLFGVLLCFFVYRTWKHYKKNK